MAGRDRAGAGGAVARARAWVSRAMGSDGHERHTALSIGKSALAASLAWFVAQHLMQASSPAFAPFTAVLMMQVTVYQSVVQSLRYVGAVALGITVQAVLGFAAGPDMLTFVVVTLIALIIGRWRPLGSQGSQVVTAAFFAFSTFLTSEGYTGRLVDLSQILLLVLIGCAIGTAVNILVLPPMRFRSAEYAIRSLAHAECDLIGDIRRGMERGNLTEDEAEDWRRRANRLSSTVQQTRSAVDTAWESVYLNPARLLRRHRHHVAFEGYQQLVDALERTTHQLGSLARSIHLWSRDEERSAYQDFLRLYGNFLASVSEITRELSGLDQDRLGPQARRLCRLAEEAQEHHDDLVRVKEAEDSPPFDDLRLPYGVLLIEAQRLMDEFQYSCDVVMNYVDRPGPADGSSGTRHI
ncbi:aromatic acid exporter family protein [Nocardiopsis sp. RV163]|uniref:FUSC family protein n=1 Tax=Nocardiopsis sp. RV163 TaxID=1661388 RepID=UPI00064BC1AB|nr:aromatic acid exporter family protein [Nocardiopsis sp. RV163]